MLNEAKARKVANRLLAALPNYHRFIPTTEIDNALVAAGFRPMEEAIYCGREGRVHEQVGDRTWITMTWYKMEEAVTPSYEIVAYVS